MKKQMGIKASDMDSVLNTLTDTYSRVNSRNLNGDKYKNKEIILRLEEDGYIVVCGRYETDIYVDFSITESGMYFKNLGGYTELKKKEIWKKIKEFIPNIIKMIIGFFTGALIVCIFHKLIP